MSNDLLATIMIVANVSKYWQPIGTAPQDGSRVLLWDGGPEPYIGFCSGDWWEGDNPTHWLPLPEPPKMPLAGSREKHLDDRAMIGST